MHLFDSIHALIQGGRNRGLLAFIRIRPHLSLAHRKQSQIELALQDLKQNFEMDLSWQTAVVTG